MVRHALFIIITVAILMCFSGGWVQHDEAAPHYSAVIDQVDIHFRSLPAAATASLNKQLYLFPGECRTRLPLEALRCLAALRLAD